ncbi:MAG: right-handed parallel beta-helix repeat-containing protein [Rhizobacter sp.]|nr:right-handed parallel beta-helix repeat-containing protein [Rhizobacter sp.]
MNVNALPAGTRLLFNRGGAWANFSVMLENPNTTAASPLTFDAYGTGAAPLMRIAANNMFNLGGGWGNTSNDGGYVIRNLKLDGMGTAEWGFWFIQTVRDVTIENTEITGFRIGINSNDTDNHTVTGITLRNNNVHRNRAMGMLGHYSNILIEGNTFEANNFSGSTFDHGTYIGGGNNITVRNNRYIRNSTVGGVCLGGNMTFHGQIDGLLIEGNTIEQDDSAPSCWLMSITQGYATPEWFRNVIVRNNTLVNGGNGITAQSAPGIVVEDNVSINTRVASLNSFMIGGGSYSNGDVNDSNAVVRNNTVCRVLSTAGGYIASVNSPGSTVSNNVAVTGTAATTGVCAR